MKITKQQLRHIIKEEKSKLLSEQKFRGPQNLDNHEMYQSDDEIRDLGQAIEDLTHYAAMVSNLMSEMSMRYGELSATNTYAVRVVNTVEEVANRFDQALEEMLKEY